MKAPIGVTGIWYKNDGNDQWMYYAPNWTDALKRLKTKTMQKEKQLLVASGSRSIGEIVKISLYMGGVTEYVLKQISVRM